MALFIVSAQYQLGKRTRTTILAPLESKVVAGSEFAETRGL